MIVGGFWRVAVVGLAAAAAVGSPGSARAEEALEFRTTGAGTRIQLHGQERIEGPSPLRIPGPLEGEFWLTAGGPGSVRQRGLVRIELDSAGSSLASFSPISVRDNVLRGIVFPGHPQLRYRERGKAAFLATAATTALGFTVWAQTESWDAEDAADAKRIALEDPSLDADSRFALETELRDAQEQQEFASRRRDLLMTASLATWGIGLAEALLFSPRFRVTEAAGNRLELRLARRTPVGAGVRSLLFPGLGQLYNGETVKASVSAGGAAAALAWVLMEQSDVENARKEFRQANRRVQYARDAAERGAAERARESARGNRDDAARDRDLALGVTAAVWGISLVDAYLSARGPTETRVRRIGLTADPSRRALAAQLRF